MSRAYVGMSASTVHRVDCICVCGAQLGQWVRQANGTLTPGMDTIVARLCSGIAKHRSSPAEKRGPYMLSTNPTVALYVALYSQYIRLGGVASPAHTLNPTFRNSGSRFWESVPRGVQ